MTHYPDGQCPTCGHRMYHFPHGLEVRGTRVPWSCVNCDYPATLDWGREAFEPDLERPSHPEHPEHPEQPSLTSHWAAVRDVVAALSTLRGDRDD